MRYGDFTLTLVKIGFFSLLALAKYFWEMLKILRKELNEIMNSVNFTTDIVNVTKYKTSLLQYPSPKNHFSMDHKKFNRFSVDIISLRTRIQICYLKLFRTTTSGLEPWADTLDTLV